MPTEQELIDFLKNIPGPHSSAPPPTASFADAVATVLRPFNVLTGGEIRARSETAQMFLRSLAAYIEEGKAFVEDWDRTGIRTGNIGYQQLTHGAQLLWAFERKRTETPGAAPIRAARVVKALIKAERDRMPVFLVQYDNKSQAYQFVGGHIRIGDADEVAAICREIAEELPANNFEFNSNAHVRLLGHSEATQISFTVGATTHYTVTYFQAIFRSPLRLQKGDEWISETELRAGKAKDGSTINEVAFVKLIGSMPGGLPALPLSIPPQRRPSGERFFDWLDRHAGRVGLAVGIVGIALTVLYGSCQHPIQSPQKPHQSSRQTISK